MAAEHRRVVAATVTNARALADNLANQGYVYAGGDASTWTMRKARRRGDITVTIVITSADPAAAPWGPPPGPRLG